MFDRSFLRLVAACCVVGLLSAFAAGAATAQGRNLWTAPRAPGVPDVCPLMPGLSAAGLVTNDTAGQFGLLAAGESVTMTATLGTATSGTFRIVGDPSGVNTLAGPAAIPGTLTFVSDGSRPGSSVGVGWFIDAANGGTVDISVRSSCIIAPSQIPATSNGMLMVIAALLAAAGAIVLVRRRA